MDFFFKMYGNVPTDYMNLPKCTDFFIFSMTGLDIIVLI